MSPKKRRGSNSKPARSRTVKRSVHVANQSGLHARAAAKLVTCAGRFKSQISLTSHKQTVNAKSILGVMILAATPGTLIHVSAKGPDAKQAVDEICGLFEHRFGEGA